MKGLLIPGSFLVAAVLIAGVYFFVGGFYTAQARTVQLATKEDCRRVQLRGGTVLCVPGVTPFSEIDFVLLGGNCAGDAKAYLTPLLHESSESTMENLDEDFACRLASFLRAGEQEGHSIKINSAVRTFAHQKRLWEDALRNYGSRATKWAAPPGRSSHEVGLAVDLRGFKDCVTRACKWAHENASRFGLHFPLSNEAWHLEPIGAVRRGNQLSAGPNNPGAVQGGNTSVAATEDAAPPKAKEEKSLLSTLSETIAKQLGLQAFSSSFSPKNGVVETSALDKIYDDSLNTTAEERFLGDEEVPSSLLEAYNTGVVSGESTDSESPPPVEFGESTPTEVIRVTGPGTTTPATTCIDGVPTRTVLGTVVCRRGESSGLPTAGGFLGSPLPAESGSGFGDDGFSFESVTNSELVYEAQPFGTERFLPSGDRVAAYDVFNPGTSIAFDRQEGLTARERILAWLERKDEAIPEESSSSVFSRAGQLVQPTTSFIINNTLGTTGQAMDALLRLRSRF